MIKNKLEYEYTQELFDRAEEALASDDEQNREVNNNDSWSSEVKRASLQNHRDAFKAEIDEYERWINWQRTQDLEISINSILEIPKVLIGARIAAKMSQKELEKRLGLEENRIQQYEDSDYQCASWLEIVDVMEALAVELKAASFVVDFQEIEARTKLLEEVVECKRKRVSY